MNTSALDYIFAGLGDYSRSCVSTVLIVCIPTSAMCSIPSGSLYDGPWTQFDCLSCCGHLAIFFIFQILASTILCILYSFKLGDNFVDLRYNCGHLLIVQILAPSSFIDTLCLYVGALRYICWPWLFWGMLLFIDRSDNRVSYFINFFFVDLECCGSLLNVQILA